MQKSILKIHSHLSLHARSCAPQVHVHQWISEFKDEKVIMCDIIHVDSHTSFESRSNPKGQVILAYLAISEAHSPGSVAYCVQDTTKLGKNTLS